MKGVMIIFIMKQQILKHYRSQKLTMVINANDYGSRSCVYGKSVY